MWGVQPVVIELFRTLQPEIPAPAQRGRPKITSEEMERRAVLVIEWQDFRDSPAVDIKRGMTRKQQFCRVSGIDIETLDTAIKTLRRHKTTARTPK